MEEWGPQVSKMRNELRRHRCRKLMSSSCSKGQQACVVVKLRIKPGSALFAGVSSHSNIYKVCWMHLCVDYVGGSMQCMCGISVIKFSLLCGYNVEKHLIRDTTVLSSSDVWCSLLLKVGTAYLVLRASTRILPTSAFCILTFGM